MTTSAEVTLNCGLVRDSPHYPLNSGLGIILICPDLYLGGGFKDLFIFTPNLGEDDPIWLD